MNPLNHELSIFITVSSVFTRYLASHLHRSSSLPTHTAEAMEIVRIPDHRQQELLAEFEKRKKASEISVSLIHNATIYQFLCIGQSHCGSNR